MAATFTVPQTGKPHLDVKIEAGKVLFVFGANGSGKSNLMLHFAMANSGVRRILAHRQTWFESDAMTLTGEQRRNYYQNIQNQDRHPNSRWREDYSSQRTNIAVYDVIDAENARARRIADAYESKNLELADKEAKSDSPKKVINELFKLSNLPIEISISKNERVMASKVGGAPYGIARLSDGERNALLVAATVVTSDPGTIFVIDEPERHLHRSIISPLLRNLFSKRPDCAFIVSTHEVSLPIDNPTADVLLVRDCVYRPDGEWVASWDLDLLPAGLSVDDQTLKEILGARRKVLFVEGADTSLDKGLYALLFPGVSIVPKSSSHDVFHAVTGIRQAKELLWTAAFGIVDSDQRGTEQVEEFRKRGVFALPFYSVESLYYHPEIQRRIAGKHAAVIGGDPKALVESAKTSVLDAVTPHVDRLALRASEKQIREKLLSKLPSRKDIEANPDISISLKTSPIVDSQRDRLKGYIGAGDIAAIICKYPVRETPALAAICSKLGFKDREQYESAVLKLIIDDSDARAYMRSLLEPLVSEIT